MGGGIQLRSSLLSSGSERLRSWRPSGGTELTGITTHGSGAGRKETKKKKQSRRSSATLHINWPLFAGEPSVNGNQEFLGSVI